MSDWKEDGESRSRGYATRYRRGIKINTERGALNLVTTVYDNGAWKVRMESAWGARIRLHDADAVSGVPIAAVQRESEAWVGTWLSRDLNATVPQIMAMNPIPDPYDVEAEYGDDDPYTQENKMGITTEETTTQKVKTNFMAGLKAGTSYGLVANGRALAVERILKRYPENAPMLRMFFATDLGEKLLDGAVLAAVTYGGDAFGDMLPEAVKENLAGFAGHATVGYGAAVGKDAVDVIVPFLVDLAGVAEAAGEGNAAKVAEIIQGDNDDVDSVIQGDFTESKSKTKTKTKVKA
jgi:hypothetical protein